jgi:hypothetical protein
VVVMVRVQLVVGLKFFASSRLPIGTGDFGYVLNCRIIECGAKTSLPAYLRRRRFTAKWHRLD